MRKIDIDEKKSKCYVEQQELSRINRILVIIKSKIKAINETPKKIQKWIQSIQRANSKELIKLSLWKNKAIITNESLREEVKKLSNRIDEHLEENHEQATPVLAKNDEQSTHRKWLNAGLFRYFGFALISLLLFVVIHGSSFLNPNEWQQTLESFRYTHQIFLKISMGFFGILSMVFSINLLVPPILQYFNSDIIAYDFLEDFRNSDPKTRLLVSCFLLYCLMQYWAIIISWEIVL